MGEVDCAKIMRRKKMEMKMKIKMKMKMKMKTKMKSRGFHHGRTPVVRGMSAFIQCSHC